MKLQFDDRLIDQRLLDHIFIEADTDTAGQYVVKTSFNGEDITLKDGFADKAAARTWLASVCTKIDAAEVGDVVDVR